MKVDFYKTILNKIYYNVKTLLDVAELRSPSFNLIQTFNKIFPEIKDELIKLYQIELKKYYFNFLTF